LSTGTVAAAIKILDPRNECVVSLTIVKRITSGNYERFLSYVYAGVWAEGRARRMKNAKPDNRHHNAGAGVSAGPQ
jgi:hypothetical protein